ncbi:unnamed protein product [Caenorhabditis auriculariae]|uniref:Uncharacterized protein n=1 Tax=Caenorhabditis auriculariae TaxID=2777116 RepID=A0A8S1GWT8_9PELO|nr:unnamed protein product [Caenorhabditis auriculariae]
MFPDGNTIITGAENGHLIVWKCAEDGLTPRQLMIGHSFPITAISQTTNLIATSRFVSTSSDGRVCLWEIQDGRCIDFVQTIHVHRHIQPYTYKTSRHTRATRLFCTGDYCDFIVMDPQDLTIVYHISSRVEPDWVCSYVIVQRDLKADQCIGVTMSGMVKLWTLVGLEKKDMANALYEDESKRLDMQHVCDIAFNTANEKIFLIVASKSWQVVDMDDLSTVASAENTVRAVAGYIIGVDKVAICYLDHSVKIFQLPISSLRGEQLSRYFNGSIPVDYFGIQIPFVVAVLEGMSNPSFAWVNDVRFACLITTTPGTNKQDILLCKTSRNTGQALVWRMPSFDKDFMKRITSTASLPFRFKGTHVESLSSIWENIHNNEEGRMPVLNSGNVRCSLFVASQGKLFLGRNDGVIVMTYACETLSRQWLHVPPERPTSRKLIGHRSAVRTMFYPYEKDTRFDPQLFLSGSDDFSAIIWNVNTAAKLYRFVVHSGPVIRFVTPPPNCSKQMSKCVCAIAEDHSVSLLNVRENKCVLLASRHPHPVKEVKWRPLDDFMLVRLDNGSVYVWQMETANIDRIVSGLVAEDVMAACDEQIGREEGTDETSANNAVQLIRAIKHKNIDAVKQRVVGVSNTPPTPTTNVEPTPTGTAMQLGSPMVISPLPGCDHGAHLVQFEVGCLIAGILNIDASEEAADAADGRTLSQVMNKADVNDANSIAGLSRRLTWQFEANLYLDVSRLMLSLLHAWNLDSDLDEVCQKKLSLHKPRSEIYFGNISRHGQLSVVLPSRLSSNFDVFSREIRWQTSHSLTTIHLLGIISTANTLMAMKNAVVQINRSRKSVAAPNPPAFIRDMSKDLLSVEKQQIKQGWSLLAALHCVLLPDHVRPRSSYSAPRIELLARRWQDACLEIREAAQALLIRELGRLGSDGRRRLIESWAPFLPPLLDDSLSIFGSKLQSSIPALPPSAPPIPPRQRSSPPSVSPVIVAEPPTTEDGESGVQQVRRNQATAIILLSVIGSEFGDELNRADLTRATAVSLLELLVAAPSVLLPVNSPLRRAAIDLLGRGFIHWEPHLEISKVLLGLLDLASTIEKQSSRFITGAPLPPIADASRTARQAISLIALARPPALLTALSMEVARYNAAAQHQTIQHTVVSPLLKSRNEVLRIIEELCEKRYSDVVEMMLPVGDVLVHCLDVSMLKHRSLAEVFPPITKFPMVAYCSSTRRIAFGGRNGTCIVHELRAAKTHTLAAHKGPTTCISFSEDGKYLATYGSQDGQLKFFQTSQTFLGMGQNQMRLVLTLQAPTVSVAMSPGGSSFKPRLVWINAKSLSLMLPEGREQRFTVT